MRNLPFILVGVMLVNGGCATAARKIEQAVRRDSDKSEKREKPTARNRPADAEEAKFSVKPDHPRLFATDRWPEANDDISRQWRSLLIKRADETTDKPPIDYSPKKLLTRSREALKRLSLFGGLYQMTHEEKYGTAGRRELLNVCGFDDWQPDDFLATAEMMNAVAIGYDWLYDALSPAERKTVVRAIVNNGLNPALDAYASRGGWTTARHNWNCVCNGGVIVAALAVGNEEPAFARKVLGQALASIEEGMAAYDDHGGTAEGPMYHSYATRYLTFAAAAMQTAVDGPNPLVINRRGNQRAWLRAADYRLLMTGPAGKSANFGDGAEILGNTAWMLWLADNADSMACSRERTIDFESDVDRAEPSIFDYLWRSQAAEHRRDKDRTGREPTAQAFGSAIVLRDSLEEEKGTFLALRTGSTADHHSHLDLGNFVLDMLGERFACDLGADNYDLPGYLGPRRADYLRSSTPGHNTLSIGEASQPLDATSQAKLAEDGRAATVDLTEAYPGARSIVRKAELSDGSVTITDTIRLKRDATFVWNLHTPAKVKLTRDGALLDNNGKRVKLTVVSPKGAKLSAEPDETSPPEQPVNDVTHIRLKVKVEDQEQIQVRFEPG